MYCKKSLLNLLSKLNLAYRRRKLKIKINNFKGCINFIKILECQGLISTYSISMDLNKNIFIIIFLKYNLNTGRGVVREIKQYLTKPNMIFFTSKMFTTKSSNIIYIIFTTQGFVLVDFQKPFKGFLVCSFVL